ncbi:growth factor receptor-bound protein 7 isoform X2 [Sus scrofa]|uniref:growth factor receptor-bound protein 7 isoform X2 n=1 Tax=Sus scrofa TaxID=9823 RepID=UPI000A2B1ADC|nr:growth factor receptor-bound protein 7 isoform X2 [Sus scrofa]
MQRPQPRVQRELFGLNVDKPGRLLGGRQGHRSRCVSPFFSLRCHGAGSVSVSSQQLPGGPVPRPWDPSWDAPISRCPSVWGGKEVPASAHSDQQETSRGGAAVNLSTRHPQPLPRALQPSFTDPHPWGALQCKGAAPSRRQPPPRELSWEREGRERGVDVSVTLEEVGGFGPGSPRVEQMGEGKGPRLAPLEPSAVPGMQVIKVYSEDGACRSVEVAAGATARYVCEMLVQRSHALSDENWGLVECHPHLALERGLEDHESVVEVQAAWPIGGDSRFVFRKNFAKYELFKNAPHSLFPEKMVSSCLDAHTGLSHEDLIQNFLNAGSFPEIQGFLQLRGSGRKLWKRFFCFLRRSGLYYSTKGTSKDPRHLQYVADVNESNVYVVTQGRKLYGMPTDFGFCIKPNKLRNGHKGLRIFCSEDEQSRTCWLAAFRLFKYGVQLYKNYQQAQSRHLRPSCAGSPPLRSVSDNTLVAMDFSGHAGRVIENPREALSAALEEAQAWRKKTNHRLSLPTPSSGTSLSAAIHRTQPWFHGRISREESQRLIGQQGLVDG